MQETNGYLKLSWKELVLYLYWVQVTGGQMWKPHIVQLKQMNNSPQQEQPTNSDEETMICFLPNQMTNDTEPVNDETLPAVTGSTPSTHRYLRRVHVLPE